MRLSWRYERTSFSLLKDRLQFAIHITAIVSIICKAIRRISGLQDLISLSCTAWN